MMKYLNIFLLLLGVYSVDISSTEHVNYKGHQVWRVIPKSKEVLAILRDMEDAFELDFWSDPVATGRPVDFRIEPKFALEIQDHLEMNGIFDYTVYISDIQDLINEQKSSRKAWTATEKAVASSLDTFVYSQYHPAEEVYEWMDLVVAEYGSFVSKEQFGVTYQGRPLYVLKFHKPSSSGNPKPTIFVDALIHCREWISTASLLFIFKEMLRNPKYTHMIDEVDWYFVPMINIDGYVETWLGDRLWRKTRSTGPGSLCTGVDGNRNWDNHWSYPGASGIPCSYTYYGPMPASESEIRHLQNYIMGVGKGNIGAYVTTHSYTQLILYAYGWTEELPPENEELNATSKLMHDAIKAVHGKYYTYGPSAITIYVSSGDTADWTYEEMGIVHSYTFELRDEGRYGFLLPPDQIIPNGEEYLAGLEVLSNFVRDDYEGSGF
uniref:carboxypeptidase B-like isoform X1 n=2 Tax=Styela clava TaxID=7725 RepID=UPI001939D436|nr:carboxypeptidase B-like isoform X1 [Styela clava]